ncbi:MAG TPA: hypothetical protein VFM93_08215 [Candidatus Limnocylindria bacterium]|nr:hypothetical protein [Candidatus Limnocylindria bacterium]
MLCATVDRGKWRDRGCLGCGSGCGGFLLVLLLGGALSVFNAAFGIGVSVGVPFMQSNITAAGSIGAKDKVRDALPAYTRERLGGNQNFFNNSTTLTIGPAEGAGVFIVGKQDGAPAIDLYIAVR